jgi:hypothetical protein
MKKQISKISVILFALCLFVTTVSQAQDASNKEKAVKKVEKVEKEFKVSAKLLKSYVGTYSFENGMGAVITLEKGKLYGAQADSSEPPMHLFAVSKSKFMLKELGAELEFNVNEKGKVVSISFYQQGQEMVGTKD